MSETATEIRPFRLILHIGAGKTGTSSIQATLASNNRRLREQGLWYLGMALEHAPRKKFDWQVRSGSKRLVSLDPAVGTRQVLKVLRGSVEALQEQGCHTAIWSNEWFFARAPAPIVDPMRQLIEDGVDVRIVAYVRRHDAWLRSAYVQWGLKHKTYQGPLRTFDEWAAGRKQGFASALARWREPFGERLSVRNLDAVGDTVADFLAVAGVQAGSIEPKRENDSPSTEDLLLHAVFSAQFDQKLSPGYFEQVVQPPDTPQDATVESYLNQLLPDAATLRRWSDKLADDRAAVDLLLVESGQMPIDTSELPAKRQQIDRGKLLLKLSQLVMNQASRIRKIEDELATLRPDSERPLMRTAKQTPGEIRETAGAKESRPAGPHESPVFALSTGRSGSTLVQRLLNCHPDLVLWGEHFGFLNGVAQSYAQMVTADPRQFPKESADNNGPQLVLPTLQDPGAPLEWVNPRSTAEFVERFRAFLSDYFSGSLPPGARWGFKEIRYNTMPTMKFLRAMYPEAKFLFIRRDVLEVARSKIFAFVKESRWNEFSEQDQEEKIGVLLQETRRHYDAFANFTKAHPGVSIYVDYEDLVAEPVPQTHAMLAHLGLDKDRFDWALAEKVMGSVITRTKRDDAVTDLVRRVAAKLQIR